ncbi:OLC1v1039167C1 [Oldenlandia corymbosa var. corymbosa]|uniref:OLC1v1039167C1 n=1 Tax=Oldenlandia corymbosa var. corymbosa TaxID=529605 RepID=A0AAV1D3P7_OLDCO|nr:OLC1v1039167C1 [Oldenlandia corymbosa var. corymbosa]
MLIIFFIMCFIPHSLVFSLPDPYTIFSKLNLPPGVIGVGSVSLDPLNQGPYVGTSDGRILKYNGTDFLDFAYLSPNRSKQLCDGTTDISLGVTCGRASGITFDLETGDLYVVNAYGGLYEVGPQGGQATLIVTDAYGVPFNFLNDCVFDNFRRVVYFTDYSLVYNITYNLLGRPPPPGDSTGRLLEYDIRTGEVMVLLDGIPSPTGPAVNPDSTFIAYGSATTQQIFRFSFMGRINEVLLPKLPGAPAKIKKAVNFGYFWVAVNQVVQQQPNPVVQPYGYKFNLYGNVALIKNFTAEYSNTQVDVVQEYYNRSQGAGTLYVGPRVASFVGKYTE